MVHPMVQAVAAVQEQMAMPHQEEEQQGPLDQEGEHHPSTLQQALHRSRQEEQDLQAALRRRLQGYHNPIASQRRGLRWIDLGSPYRS